MNDQASKLGASFVSLESFMKNLEELESVFKFISQGLRKDQEFTAETKQSEADKILEELGAVEVISSSGAGGDFHVSVARQLDALFTGVIEKNGGAMSLIDLYLYYNRMRGSDLITPDDLLKACRNLKSVSNKLELREENGGMKIVQLKVYPLVYQASTRPRISRNTW